MCSADQEARFAKFRDRKHRIGIQTKMSLLLELTGLIAKDVVRTDRHLEYFKEPDSDALKKLSDILITYSFYNFDLGKGWSHIGILFISATHHMSFALLSRICTRHERPSRSYCIRYGRRSRCVLVLQKPDGLYGTKILFFIVFFKYFFTK